MTMLEVREVQEAYKYTDGLLLVSNTETIRALFGTPPNMVRCGFISQSGIAKSVDWPIGTWEKDIDQILKILRP